jgi:hypothetical protein
LVYQDEVEIHRHPTLTRMWAPIGEQPQVPAPGQNEKQVVYGGVDYATGKIVYTIAATKSGVHFLAFLVALVAAYAGRKVRLVCDNGRFHCTKAVQLWLEEHRDQIEIYWRKGQPSAVAAVLSELEFDRAALGPLEKNGVGQRVV